jgi:peptidoglycan lytic transglycosylase G
MNDLDLFSDPSRGGHLPSERLGRRDQRAARRRQRRRRAGSHAATFFALAFLVAVLGGGGLLGYVALRSYMIPPDYAGQGVGQVVVQIKDGDSAKTMGDRLQVAQVVKSSRAFVKVAKKEPRAQSIQPGFYTMHEHMAAGAALALLLDPKSRAGNQITVPEGLRAQEIMQQLAKKTGIPLRDFQRALSDPAGLGLPSYAKGRVEGYLFPARYDLNPNASARDIIKMMVARFNREAADADLVRRAHAAHLTPGQVVTVASLLQAEGGRHSDYSKIARVIYNRVHLGKPLQLDTTVLYALNKRDLRVFNRDTQVKSPYNTYLIKGLPPGAIDSPGLPAIEAAMRPAKGTWLFFVTTDPGRKITEFTDNQQDFARLKAKLDHYLATHGGR